MNRNIKQILYWTPRVLCIIFSIFLSMFALDVFDEGYGFWQTINALLLHLVPTFLIVAVLIITWGREWVGAILFPSLAVFYVVISRGRFPMETYLLISFPLALIGVLFLINWLFREQLRKR